jgi:hypothetical protein
VIFGWEPVLIFLLVVEYVFGPNLYNKRVQKSQYQHQFPLTRVSKKAKRGFLVGNASPRWPLKVNRGVVIHLDLCYRGTRLTLPAQRLWYKSPGITSISVFILRLHNPTPSAFTIGQFARNIPFKMDQQIIEQLLDVQVQVDDFTDEEILTKVKKWVSLVPETIQRT